MADSNSDQKFVEDVVKAIVNHPEDVKTERAVDEMGVLITLHINPADMGQVIGRQGQTARAIRTLLKIVGAKKYDEVKLHEGNLEAGATGILVYEGRHGVLATTPFDVESVSSDEGRDLTIHARGFLGEKLKHRNHERAVLQPRSVRLVRYHRLAGLSYITSPEL